MDVCLIRLGMGCALLVLGGNLAGAEWTPPTSPNPQMILREAQDDAAEKRYEDALAKHVWFHENALTIQPSLAGVRLSFALEDWRKLCDAYPPALAKLREVRDQAAARVREEKESRAAFRDFIALNRVLKEDRKSGELFIWLDGHKSGVARAVYTLAEPALIRAGEYRLCGKYLAPKADWKRIHAAYHQDNRLAQDPRHGKRMREFAEKRFTNGTATLVALLTLNDRRDEADEIVAKALKEWDDPGFKQQLEKAKRGEVPPP